MNSEELKKEMKVWECRNCGTIIYHSKNPGECSCVNKSSFFRNSQVESLVKREFERGQLASKCSLCKDGLKGSQLICWTCFCDMKDKVREEATKDERKRCCKIIKENWGYLDSINGWKELTKKVSEVGE